MNAYEKNILRKLEGSDKFFQSYDDLFTGFPGTRPDHHRPLDPIDFEKLKKFANSQNLKLEPNNESSPDGLWFSRR